MLDMKWYGWLVMAIAGCALWTLFIAMINSSVGHIANDFALFVFGCTAIIILCITIPTIRRIIRKSHDEATKDKIE